jgi:D-alanine-D-alanine ligase
MNKKIRLAILFGGKSAEHEVSLQSAKNVVAAIDKNKYEIILIGIDKKGHWHLNEASNFLLHENNPKLIRLNEKTDQVALVHRDKEEQLVNLSTFQSTGPVDVAFPLLHGPLGEDGTVQGLLKLADVPFVGSSVLGSAVAMDKDITKRLLRDAGIPTANFRMFKKSTADKIIFEEITNALGLPLFVKPCNLGSSVGISKINNINQFKKAIRLAFEFDNKILIEEYINGREFECSVLGNENPIASFPGEILPQHDFYSYNAKYIDDEGAIVKAPADLSDDLVKKVQNLAIKVCDVLNCEGMARVDFFLKENNELYVSELNTIPGFTRISLYPKLWELSGIPYSELIDRLIQLALERYKNEKKLKVSY